MLRRVLPAALVATAAFADLAGAHALAFYVLLAAVPAVAWCALLCLGDILDVRRDGNDDPVLSAQGVLWALLLLLVLVGEAGRGPSVTAGTVPTFATSALLACVAVCALQGALGLGAHAVRHALRRPAGSALPVR
jgi:hypothetical protein